MPDDAHDSGSPSRSTLAAVTPSSGRTSVELAAWGPIRDAITAIHNVETLLRSPRIGPRVLGEVLPELGSGVETLRAAFARSVESARALARGAEGGAAGAHGEEMRAAREGLARFAEARLDELELAMRSAPRAPGEPSRGELDARARQALEQVVGRVSGDLDAAVELLDLTERSAHGAPTELAVDELARVALRAAARGRDREVPVRLVASGSAERAVHADPYVAKRLMIFAIARAVATFEPGEAGLVLRATCESAFARFDLVAARPEDHAIPAAHVRLAPRVQPTDAVVASAARAAGFEVSMTSDAITIRAPLASS
jgi:predicted nucleic acid-binding protein